MLTTPRELRTNISLSGPMANDVWRLWKAGADTFDIAKALHLPEWHVANLLFHIRDVRHRETERA